MLMFDASFGLYTIQFKQKFPEALLSWWGRQGFQKIVDSTAQNDLNLQSTFIFDKKL